MRTGPRHRPSRTTVQDVHPPSTRPLANTQHAVKAAPPGASVPAALREYARWDPGP
eukprot:CAMPEP_0181247924 /NCGR_PEP_ID=MMETSP1096-20121128/44886_1 /TAXON_ID=156174 ORGANISM="Chrysochromulina ericina, Strain CCMP281" /NCGR_SAMPLE_ID=MMETSP1096 /ASSEMBLY_ACC=CAM_ASM_000453 /LENGTH=55 /DNA_ID=CAMNT_0023345039 /DNA_START=242 /DNA_END=407 /DNA_ORIENTATION=+